MHEISRPSNNECVHEISRPSNHECVHEISRPSNHEYVHDILYKSNLSVCHVLFYFMSQDFRGMWSKLPGKHYFVIQVTVEITEYVDKQTP